MGIDGDQDLGQDRACALVEIADVVAVAGDDQQIGQFRRRGFGIGLDQGDDVLAMVGAREGQDQRLVRLVEKAVDDLGEGRERIVVGRRMELLEIRAGRDDAHPLGQIVIVESVLFLDLVVGAGDDQLGVARVVSSASMRRSML
jgi:hypothetical protein